MITTIYLLGFIATMLYDYYSCKEAGIPYKIGFSCIGGLFSWLGIPLIWITKRIYLKQKR